jgi:hypothetical protein
MGPDFYVTEKALTPHAVRQRVEAGEGVARKDAADVTEKVAVVIVLGRTDEEDLEAAQRGGEVIAHDERGSSKSQARCLPVSAYVIAATNLPVTPHAYGIEP